MNKESVVFFLGGRGGRQYQINTFVHIASPEHVTGVMLCIGSGHNATRHWCRSYLSEVHVYITIA